jgi:hypothetical protein
MLSTCEVYTVKTGDTMASIASMYTTAGKKVTAEEICNANGKLKPVDTCNQVDIGDDYMIPYEGSDSTCSQAGQEGFLDRTTTGGSTTGGSTTGGSTTQQSPVGQVSNADKAFFSIEVFATCILAFFAM